MKSRRIYARWSLLYSGLILLPFFFNLVIDPYGYFQVVDIARLNSNKSEVLSEYSTKYYFVSRAKPDVLMLGTSRMLTHDPHDVQKYTGGRAYNLALSGSNMYEQYEYLKYMTDNDPIRYVVMGLDFFSFNPDNKNKPGFVRKRFDGFYYRDYVDGLIGIETLKASVLTLKNSMLDSCTSMNYKEGYTTWCSREKAVTDAGEGVILRAMKSSLKTFSTDKAAYNSEKFRKPDSIADNLAYFKKIVELCYSKGIMLKVYISPIYEAQFDLIHAMGLGDSYGGWKREIARLVDFYDFTGRNSVTVNKDLWWDSSHIRKEGGKIIFARLFEDKKTELPPDFGVHVSSENIEEHIRSLALQVEKKDLSDILELNGY